MGCLEILLKEIDKIFFTLTLYINYCYYLLTLPSEAFGLVNLDTYCQQLFFCYDIIYEEFQSLFSLTLWLTTGNGKYIMTSPKVVVWAFEPMKLLTHS